MPLLSKEELTAYITQKKQNNHFLNSEGMAIYCMDGNEMYTYFTLWSQEDGDYELYISTGGESLDEFIEGFRIQTLEDVEKLGYNNSWMRYLNGKAEIGVTPVELEATLTFRLSKNKTIISSLELHFYDEMNIHLTLPEEFVKYVTDNERSLQIASSVRYKY